MVEGLFNDDRIYQTMMTKFCILKVPSRLQYIGRKAAATVRPYFGHVRYIHYLSHPPCTNQLDCNVCCLCKRPTFEHIQRSLWSPIRLRAGFPVTLRTCLLMLFILNVTYMLTIPGTSLFCANKTPSELQEDFNALVIWSCG